MPPRRRKAILANPGQPGQIDFAAALFADLPTDDGAEHDLGQADAVREAPDPSLPSAITPAPRDAFAALAPVFRLKLVQTEWLTLPWLPAGQGRPKISNPNDAAQLLFRYLDGADREHFVALLLDVKGQLIGVTTVSIGDLSSAIIHPREVFKPAIIANAASIVVAHNHPSGDPAPSPEDIAVTTRLVEASEVLGITLLDHMVLGDGRRFVSLKERGLMPV